MTGVTCEEMEKRFIDEKDQVELGWNPKITGDIVNIQDDFIAWLEKLSWTGAFPVKQDNEVTSFYMRVVDNHIEIGVANIEFVR